MPVWCGVDFRYEIFNFPFAIATTEKLEFMQQS